MQRQGMKPRFRIGIEGPGRSTGLREELPFRRSWIAIGLLAAFDAAFVIPAIMTFREAAEAWASFESLFDLVIAVFLSAWLLGWSVAPLLMSAVLLLMLFGREVMRAQAGVVEIWIGIPLLGFAAIYDANGIRNLRIETPEPKSRHLWRGPHWVFDYGAKPVRFGSNVNSSDAECFKRRIETATGVRMRRGEAAPKELLEPPHDPEALADGLAAPKPAPGVSPAEPPGTWTTSTVALVLANLVPVAGAAFLNWRLSDVMVLYWAESAIIGAFNLCKIAIIGRWSALLAGPFFVGHFGGFMAVHFLFVYTLFVKGIHGPDTGTDLADIAHLFAGLWPALAALFISHGYSFVVNFIGRQEYVGRTVRDQMSEPYSRIIFMHLVLIFGGFLAMLLGDPVPVLLLVITLKVWFDLRAHRKQRAAESGTGRPGRG